MHCHSFHMTNNQLVLQTHKGTSTFSTCLLVQSNKQPNRSIFSFKLAPQHLEDMHRISSILSNALHEFWWRMIFQRPPSELMDVHSFIMDQFQNSDPVNMYENLMPKTLERSTQWDVLPDFKIQDQGGSLLKQWSIMIEWTSINSLNQKFPLQMLQTECFTFYGFKNFTGYVLLKKG